MKVEVQYQEVCGIGEMNRMNVRVAWDMTFYGAVYFALFSFWVEDILIRCSQGQLVAMLVGGSVMLVSSRSVILLCPFFTCTQSQG